MRSLFAHVKLYRLWWLLYLWPFLGILWSSLVFYGDWDESWFRTLRNVLSLSTLPVIVMYLLGVETKLPFYPYSVYLILVCVDEWWQFAQAFTPDFANIMTFLTLFPEFVLLFLVWRSLFRARQSIATAPINSGA